MSRVVVIDNYDSFTYNLVQTIYNTTLDVHVFYNDKIDLDGLRQLKPDYYVLSPGPGRPERVADFGVCKDIIDAIRNQTITQPVLGVCLGHQGIASGFGAQITQANTIMHGRTSMVHHQGTGLFEGIENPFQVMRYHSLTVEPNSLPACFYATAHTDDGTLMAFQHQHQPLYGVQFHPESIGTPLGAKLIANFLSVESRL